MTHSILTVIMDMGMGYDNEQKIQELTRKFEEAHLIYLQTDDSPRKLDQRHKLEGFIERYLCLISNERKYIFEETSKILDLSATFKEFSGYKACTGWSTISLYASNLFSQPWRKEYKNINTYSGYYQHEIVANLVGAEMMFQIMGYKNDGSGILRLRGPIDPDKVSNVSRDAIVAFVECKIMKRIWENVTNNYNISWLEILEFRKNHTGTPEQAIRALNYRHLNCSQNYLSNIQVDECREMNSEAFLHLLQNRSYKNNVCNNHRNYVQSDNLIAIKGDHPYCYDFYDINNKFKKKYSDKLMEDSLQDESLQKNHISIISNSVESFRPDTLVEENNTGTKFVPHRNNVTSNFNNNINLNVISNEQPEVKAILNTFGEEKEYNILNNSNTECMPIKNIDNVNYTHNDHINTWNCSACTFLNTQFNTICQMCSKSRLQNIENESVISGGQECTKCTLINKKNVRVCEACGTSLNNTTLAS